MQRNEPRPPTADELEAEWIWALDTGSFAACHALIRSGFTARADLATYRDLTPCGQRVYDRLAAICAAA